MTFAVPGYDAISGQWAGLFIARRRRLRHPRRRLDHHELILVRAGELGIAEDGEPFRVASGQTLLLSAGREHDGTADYPPDLSFYWLHFTCRAGTAPLSVPRHASPRRPELLQAMFHRYLDDQMRGLHTPVTAGLAVHAMLAELAAAALPGTADPAAALVGRAEAWIGHHYQDAISTREVAAALGHNPDYLGRVFRRCTGRTVVEAITQRRLNEARQRLIDSATDVAGIARAAGFNDLTHFRRVFRRQWGCSPGDFRAQHARVHVNSH